MIQPLIKYATALLICFSALQLTAQRHYHQPRIKVGKNQPFKTQTHLPTETIANIHPAPIQFHAKKDSLPGIQKIVELNNIPSVVHPIFRILNPKKGISEKQRHIREMPIKQTRKNETTITEKRNRSSERSFHLNANSDLNKAQYYGCHALCIVVLIIFGLVLLLGGVGMVFVILSLASVLAMETFLGIGLVFVAIGIIAGVFLGRCLFSDDF